MDNRRKASIVVFIMAALLCAMMLTGYICGAVYQPSLGHYNEESLSLNNCSIVENAGSLNASLTIIGTTDIPTTINELKISNFTLTELPGVTVYLNGTTMNYAAAPFYILEKGDTILVNMIFPCINSIVSRAQDVGYVSMQVLTSQATYYLECDIQNSTI